MEFGVNGNPFAPHSSLEKVDAQKVVAPSSALPRGRMSESQSNQSEKCKRQT